jgi:hypothetical protein
MKKFFKSALVACAALAVVACQNNPVDGPEKGAKSITIKISQNSVTRAPGAAVADAAAVTANDGALYFAAGDKIVKVVEIIKEGTPTANQVAMGDLTDDGKIFGNLPAIVDAVYFAANLDSYEFASVDDLKKAELDLEYLGDVDDLPIYGSAAVVATTTVEGATHAADIEAVVVAGRFEIAGNPVPDQTTETIYVASADVVAIYLDNIYTGVQLDNTAIGTVYGAPIASLEDYKADEYPNAWHVSGLSYDLYVEAVEAVADDTTTPDVDEAEEAIPGSLDGGKIWGYNLPAPAAATLPVVVVELDNVVLSNDQELGKKFLTYIPTGTVGSSAGDKTFAKSKVYKTSLPAFKFTDLTDYPYQEGIDIQVDVAILPWTAVPVNYTFN